MTSVTTKAKPLEKSNIHTSEAAKATAKATCSKVMMAMEQDS